VLAGVAAARWAADNLVRRLGRELREAKEVIASLQAQLACGSRGDAAEAEARRREAIARPALVARVRGRRETRAQRQRRNVAWHAERCPSADAPPQAWRRAQDGPRLPGGPLPGEGRGGAAQGAAACEVGTCVCEVQPPVECALGACVAEAPARLPSARVAAARAPLRSSAQPCLPEWARWAALLEELGVAQLAEQGCGEGGAESAEAEEVIAEFGCEAEEDRAAAARCSAWRPRRSGGSLVGGSEFEGESEFEDLGSEHGQFLRDEFSGGSELAAGCELARAAWLGRSGSRRGGGGEPEPEEERGALALAADGSEVGPEELRGSEGGNVSFLDGFSVAAVACAATGPKSGVESLLDLAEARALGVRLGSAGCPDAEGQAAEGEGSSVGGSEFEDLGSEHGRFLRGEFSDGSEQAAECELARARAPGARALNAAAQAAILSGDLAEGLRLLEAAQVFGQ
ncbi:unnamed protein product, partial [Prorocentrum cordatum]